MLSDVSVYIVYSMCEFLQVSVSTVLAVGLPVWVSSSWSIPWRASLVVSLAKELPTA